MTDKEFDEKIALELEKFREVVAENHKFRQLYDWISGLIEITAKLRKRIEQLEKDINNINDELTND